MKHSIRDVISFIVDNRGKNPPYATTEGIPIIDNYLIANNYYPNLLNVNRYIDDYLLDNFIRDKSIKDDVLVTLVGNGLGNVCLCPERAVIIQNTIGLRCNNLMLQKYLYYFLITRNSEIKGLNRGASQPSAKVSDLLDIEIDVPRIETQRHIVNTIGTIDDLIENRIKLIAKIKEYRKIAFLNWQMSSKYEVNLSEIVSFENGAQPPKEQHIYEPKSGYIRFVQNRDYDSDSHLTYIPISKRNHLCDEFDIMMDKYGEAGAVRYGIAGAYNVALLKIIPKETYTREWIRDYLSQTKIKDVLYLSSQASTRPSLNESTFISLRIPVLNDIQFSRYESQMKSFLVKELLIREEIAKLKEVKTKLLDKYF